MKAYNDILWTLNTSDNIGIGLGFFGAWIFSGFVCVLITYFDIVNNQLLFGLAITFLLIGLAMFVIVLGISRRIYYSSRTSYVFYRLCNHSFFERWPRYDTRIIVQKKDVPIFSWIDFNSTCVLCRNDKEASKYVLQKGGKVIGEVRWLYKSHYPD